MAPPPTPVMPSPRPNTADRHRFPRSPPLNPGRSLVSATRLWDWGHRETIKRTLTVFFKILCRSLLRVSPPPSPPPSLDGRTNNHNARTDDDPLPQQPSTITNVSLPTLWRGLQTCLRHDDDDDDDGDASNGGGGGGGGGKSCYKIEGSPADHNPLPAFGSGGGGGGGGGHSSPFVAGGGGSGGGSGGSQALQAALDESVADTGYSAYELTGRRSGGGGGVERAGGGGVRGKSACIVSGAFSFCLSSLSLSHSVSVCVCDGFCVLDQVAPAALVGWLMT